VRTAHEIAFVSVYDLQGVANNVCFYARHKISAGYYLNRINGGCRIFGVVYIDLIEDPDLAEILYVTIFDQRFPTGLKAIAHILFAAGVK
jgi:hypothetical protein